MKSALSIACLAALSLALAACKGEQPPRQDSAEGEILPGSASDAMLPYDTVRSQPPLAPIATEQATGRTGTTADEASAEESGEPEMESASETAPSPGPSPAPKASATATE